MNGSKRLVPVVAAIVALAACGGGGGGGGGRGNDDTGGGGVALAAAFQGTWADCYARGETGSGSTRLVISGTSFTIGTWNYASADCSGEGTQAAAPQVAVTFAGSAVAATLGAASVTATALDLRFPGGVTSYDLVYVDTAADPDVIYLSGTAGLRPSERPSALDPHSALTKVVTGGGTGTGTALPAAYQGTWSSCAATGAGGSARLTITISGTAYSVHSADYGTPDCTGASTPGWSDAGTMVTPGPVSATLGAAAVTAQAIDVTPAGGATVYDILYVDTAADPDVLYLTQAESSAAASRPTALDGPALTRQP